MIRNNFILSKFSILSLCLMGCSAQQTSTDVHLKLKKIDEDGHLIQLDKQAYLRCENYEHQGQCENSRSIPDIDENDSENKKESTPKFKTYSDKNYNFKLLNFPDGLTFYSNITANSEGKIFAAGGAGLQFVSGFDQENKVWERRFYSRFSDSFRDIKFVDNTLFATGTSGVIYRSRNFGKNWELFNKIYINPYRGQDINNKEIEEKWLAFHEKKEELSFTYSDAYSIAFDLNSSKPLKSGVVVGFQKILRTDDTGQTWNLIDYSLKDNALQEATFSEENHVWAVGSLGTVLFSKDAGKTWAKQTTIDTDTHWMSIDFSNENHGCLAGGQEIWCTENKGLTWTKANIQIPQDIELTRISRLRWMDNKEGWAVVTSGQILHTKDAGKNWNVWQDLTKTDPNYQQVQLWGLYVDKVHQKIYSSGTLIVYDSELVKRKANSFSNGGIILSWQK